MEPITVETSLVFNDRTRDLYSVTFRIEFSGVTVEVDLGLTAEDPPGGWVALLEPGIHEYGEERASICSNGEYVLFEVVADGGDGTGSGSTTLRE
jgi:hypothetical protein